MDKFSVLMSVYHREKSEFLDTAIESIFRQTTLPDEVVLVKDGPLTAKLDAVICKYTTKYPMFKIVSIPQNVGLGEALNQGLKHCSYELIARMDSDDICFENRFTKQLMIFDQYPNIDIVGSVVAEFIETPNIITAIRKLPQRHPDIIEFAKTRCPLNHPSVMFRRQSILNVAGYQHFYLFEDYYLWMRMIKAGCVFYNIQEPLLYFRANPEMIKRRGGFKYAISEVRLQKKFYRMKLITFPCFVKNIVIRFTVRIIPNVMRSWIYTNFLRN